ncbi:MAG: AAA-like domain-containing protein [Candidatus Aminicenantes bacterium]|nr:MAG: AAA-like domain-containing protein [Candidatus Aminicenantes bacterium]
MLKKAGNTNKMIYRKPKLIFEDSGSVNPEESYYVPLDNVTNRKKQDMKTMVDRGRYFSIFAPRQSGKTTFFKRMCDELHKDRTYIGIILNFQKYEKLDKTQFYAQIEKKLYHQLRKRLKEVGCNKSEAVEHFLQGHRLTDHITFGLLFEELNQLIEFKKIVIFIDEFDGIPKSELGNFLTTLRDLYQEYKEVKQKALYSIGLVGIRNITKLIVGGVSPFNIADQVDLPPFSLKNVGDLYAQYTRETNQPFTKEAVKKIHEETGGQPWLVNRLGTILTLDIKPETVESIDEQDVEKAIEILLKERNDHFDNLDEKAKLHKETFVEIVFDNVEYNPGDEAQTWLEQFGLVKNKNGMAVAANNIYKARYINTFFREAQVPDDISTVEYDLPGNLLDMENVLLDFEQYIAQIGVRAFYKEKKPYEKTGQFLLTAWLYRFVKGGDGDLRYEAISGLGRMDIILNYKGRKYIIETKVNHRKLTRTLNQGITQVSKTYLATEAADEGYLVIFDTKTPVGEECEPRYHQAEEKKVTSFIIGIGRSD